MNGEKYQIKGIVLDYRILNCFREMSEMKKMLLIGMLVVSGLSYGRDFERRESQEFQAVQNVRAEDQSMMSREREISENNMEIYSDFHRDLDNMDRGHESK